MSAAASLKTLNDKKGSFLGKLFASKGGIALEKVMFLIEEDMNNHGAVRLHIVVVYDEELMAELKKMSANEYFHQLEQLTKDHPDKMKIFEWEFAAKKRITPWITIEYPADHMTPLAAFIFAKYSGTGEHRARIPTSSKKAKIKLDKDVFQVIEKDEVDD